MVAMAPSGNMTMGLCFILASGTAWLDKGLHLKESATLDKISWHVLPCLVVYCGECSVGRYENGADSMQRQVQMIKLPETRTFSLRLKLSLGSRPSRIKLYAFIIVLNASYLRSGSKQRLSNACHSKEA